MAVEKLLKEVDRRGLAASLDTKKPGSSQSLLTAPAAESGIADMDTEQPFDPGNWLGIVSLHFNYRESFVLNQLCSSISIP
jgi:hypothetical protein